MCVCVWLLVTGRIPAVFGGLTHMTQITMNTNRLTGNMPSTLSSGSTRNKHDVRMLDMYGCVCLCVVCIRAYSDSLWRAHEDDEL